MPTECRAESGQGALLSKKRISVDFKQNFSWLWGNLNSAKLCGGCRAMKEHEGKDGGEWIRREMHVIVCEL